jgi:putative endonuclease
MSLKVGHLQEDIALEFLLSKGLALVERNFRTKAGEIDLIMEEKRPSLPGVLVFIEVRYRKNPYYGSGLESIHATKIRKLRLTAALYLQKKGWTDKIFCRFDVISWAHSTDIQWIRDAF